MFEYLTPEQADIIFAFAFDMILTNVEIGLGVIDTDNNPLLEKAIEEMTDKDMFFFNKINEIYRKAHGDCYFCRDDVDINAEPITSKTPICFNCKMKIGKLLEYAGIPMSNVFNLQNPTSKIDPE